MKKVKSELEDWGRAEYKRSNLGKPVRAKYAKRINDQVILICLDPEVTKSVYNK